MYIKNKDTLCTMKPKATGKLTYTAAAGGSEVADWEVRPGGMLVQKRNLNPTQSSTPIPTIKIRVKYESSYHEVNISPQATFGELKKMLGSRIELHPNDQKLMFKENERDSKSYLDVVGVKDGSKMVVIEDVIRRERRVLELQKNVRMVEEASKAISEVGMEVEKLAKQVAALESEIFGGRKVAERVLLNLIELLMTQLIKLDGIIVDGEVKLQRKMQVRRVQKYIETLDMLKMRNSMIGNNVVRVPLQHDQRKQRNSTVPKLQPVVVTTKWETFDIGSA